ncbi:MAG: IS3 family transposase, partial [Acidobacteriaceae bacterium]|nr:IS3 family transposase [Acidobacteriaceae bacterium]
MRHVDGQQGELTIERMCTLAAVSRAGYYRFCAPAPGADTDEEESRLRDAIQREAIESRHYGYRRVTRALRDQGWEVNHKRVARLMREDGLLAIRKRRFLPQTTDSEHEFEVALNVARQLIPTAINQLWVADITYVRLGRVDVFLAVVMDAYSRRIVGWNLAPKITTELALTALRNAIASRQPAPGLIHHSDRGVQYASVAYVDTLLQHGMIPSMSRPGNPYDNAKCERFLKTLKQEEIRCFEYRDIEDLRTHLTVFFDRYYNATRLHSALGYLSPEEFERRAAQSTTAEIPQAPRLSFSRHEEIYPSDV